MSLRLGPWVAVQPGIWLFKCRWGHFTLCLFQAEAVLSDAASMQSSVVSPLDPLCSTLSARRCREKAQYFRIKKTPTFTSIVKLSRGAHRGIAIPASSTLSQLPVSDVGISGSQRLVAETGNLLRELQCLGCTNSSWSLFIQHRGWELFPADAPCTHRHSSSFSRYQAVRMPEQTGDSVGRTSVTPHQGHAWDGWT